MVFTNILCQEHLIGVNSISRSSNLQNRRLNGIDVDILPSNLKDMTMTGDNLCRSRQIIGFFYLGSRLNQQRKDTLVLDTKQKVGADSSLPLHSSDRAYDDNNKFGTTVSAIN